MLFSWKGVSPGCFESTSAESPAMCGAAKLLPVHRSVLPPNQATSRSTPRAKNSTGGVGFAYHSQGVGSLVAPDRDHRREAPRVALDRHVVRRRDEHRAAGSRRRRRARGASSANLRFVVERLRLTTSKPCSIAWRRPPRMRSALPVLPSPSTRTLCIRQSGASERMIPAQARAVADRRRPPRRARSSISSPSNDDGDRALEPADERMVAVDAAVEDADVDALRRLRLRSPSPA